jgi:hypothetical protein
MTVLAHHASTTSVAIEAVVVAILILGCVALMWHERRRREAGRARRAARMRELP